MLFSYDWLCQYLDEPPPAVEAAARLTAAGLAVEGLEPRGDDMLLEVDVTTNRPDCMNHLGLARELAVLTEQPLVYPWMVPEESTGDAAASVTVEIEDSSACPRYVARVIRGARVGPSPDWLIDRLESIGQRPINNVVDVTNYVLWETGQPLHAFDLATLARARIVVRRARGGESLVTLDGEHRVLSPEILVIADAERPVALAGVMGGEETEVVGSTTDILIESAHFDRRRVRAGSGQLGLHTDASHRFERGADPAICRSAADRAAELILEVAGGQLMAGAVDARDETAVWRLDGAFSPQRLASFAGAEIAPTEAARVLAGLGFEVEATNEPTWQVRSPTWRYYDMSPDATGRPGYVTAPIWEADLFEEVLRIVGYDRIPSALPAIEGPDAGSSASHLEREEIRGHLQACGFNEVVNYAFEDRAAEASLPAVRRQGPPLELANPLSELYAVMRRSLAPGLLANAAFNWRRGAQRLRLFEIGHLFPGESSEEIEAVSLIAGGARPVPWDRPLASDLFELKGVVESLAARFDSRLVARKANLPGLVPGTSSELLLPGEEAPIGYLGQVDAQESPFPLYVAELQTARITGQVRELRISVPSRFPGIRADLTLTHDLAVPWEAISNAVEEAGSEDLVTFGMKDRYTGDGVPAGAVNTTVYFVYNASDRSLTQDEVNERFEILSRDLESRFGREG